MKRFCLLFVLSLFIGGTALSRELKPQRAEWLYGYVDSLGNWVVKPKYKKAEPFSEGMAQVQRNSTRRGAYWDRWGYIDEKGVEAIACKYFESQPFSEGLAAVRISDRGWGFINKTGKIVIPPAGYADARSFSEGLAAVEVASIRRWGFIDKSGKFVIPPQYENAGRFSEGLAAVRIGNKWGYIDRSGTLAIPCKYEDADPFSEGLALVAYQSGGGYGGNGSYVFINDRGEVAIHQLYRYGTTSFKKGIAYVRRHDNEVVGPGWITHDGRWFMTKEEAEAHAIASKKRAEDERLQKLLSEPFSLYAKKIVERQINDWQKKGEFERSDDYTNRVNERTRKQKIAELAQKAEEQYIEERAKVEPIYTLGTYDANNEVYLIRCNDQDILVPVPFGEAVGFKDQWDRIDKKPSFFIENDHLAVSNVLFSLPNGKRYEYSNQASLTHTEYDVDYKFDPIEIDWVDDSNRSGRQSISQIKLTVGKSDVDTNIPQTDKVNDKTFAVIIANQNYRREVPVEFAHNDGTAFRDYCLKTLGIPENNIHFVADATLNDIQAEVDWLGKVGMTYGEEARLILYYAGHGIPDERTRESYLLPSDGYGSNTRTGYPLNDIYARLSETPAVAAVFLDACFSGACRSNNREMLASARGVAIKPKMDLPPGNLIVFSAVQEDETAYPYREKGHGIFTYFLLKKLQESKGETTLGELSEYVIDRVSKVSLVDNPKNQTPKIMPSALLEHTWHTLKLNGHRK